MIHLNEPPETPDWHTEARCCPFAHCNICEPPDLPENITPRIRVSRFHSPDLINTRGKRGIW